MYRCLTHFWPTLSNSVLAQYLTFTSTIYIIIRQDLCISVCMYVISLVNKQIHVTLPCKYLINLRHKYLINLRHKLIPPPPPISTLSTAIAMYSLSKMPKQNLYVFALSMSIGRHYIIRRDITTKLYIMHYGYVIEETYAFLSGRHTHRCIIMDI